MQQRVKGEGKSIIIENSSNKTKNTSIKRESIIKTNVKSISKKRTKTINNSGTASSQQQDPDKLSLDELSSL